MAISVLAILQAAIALSIEVATALLIFPVKSANPESIREDRILMLEYGSSRFPESSMIRNGSNRILEFSWYFYLIQKNGKNYLVDTGACDASKIKAFGIQNYAHPVELLRRAGVSPESIDGIFLTHNHFDHSGCLSQYPGAQVYRSSKDAPPDWVSIRAANGHAKMSNIIVVSLGGQSALFTSDECYFREHCLAEKELAEVSVHNRGKNRLALRSIRQAHGNGTQLFTFHDPSQKKDAVYLAKGIYLILKGS